MIQNTGAVIDDGVADWQVFQQDAAGRADITVAGRWSSANAPGVVEVRLVHEDTGSPVARGLDWSPAETRADGTWCGMLKNVPAGGMYRLETHFLHKDCRTQEWAQRGDIRHFICVGDLWIIAGQSNSAGYGRGPSFDPPELGIHVFNNAMRWAIAAQPLNESTDTAHPVNSEGGNSGHSPWLHCARLVRRATGTPIGLLQTSLGGSSLVRWNPAEPGDHKLFENMVAVVKAAGGRVRGMLWYQGCSDASPESGTTYLSRFSAAVTAWREALGNPELHVLTVQINRCTNTPTPESDLGWSLVREAQRQAAHTVRNVTVVPTLDLPLSDGIHNSPAGNMLLADRAAQAVLAACYGKELEHRAPEPLSATRDDDGKAISITFSPVTSRMDSIAPTANPFMVEDDEGIVPGCEVQYTGSAVVRIILGRTLKGNVFVSGAYGINPAVAPCDMVRFMPMLGFHRFPVPPTTKL